MERIGSTEEQFGPRHLHASAYRAAQHEPERQIATHQQLDVEAEAVAHAAAAPLDLDVPEAATT